MVVVDVTCPARQPQRTIVFIYGRLHWHVHHILNGRWYEIVKNYDAGGSGVWSRTERR